MDIKDMPRRSGRATHKVTLREVANAAGVSMMTVSNVIHDRATVGADIRALVQSKITELGYTPNRAAQQLAGISRPHLGLVCSGVNDPSIAPIIVGAMNAASRLEVDVSVQFAMLDDSVTLRNMMHRMQVNGIDGFLLPSLVAESVVLSFKNKDLDVPRVAIAPGTTIPGMSSVRCDERKASYELISLLLDLGHTKIGHISGSELQSSNAARIQGYKEALADRDRKIQSEWVVRTEPNFRDGVKAAERLLDAEPGLTAIFAANDTLAASVLTAAYNRNIAVPDKLSVVGYGDSPVAEQVWPGLTTIRQDALAMAERAVELLADAVLRRKASRDEHVNEDVVLPYQIVMRGSVAKVER